MTSDTTAAAQARRRAAVYRLHRETNRPHFGASGRWICREQPKDAVDAAREMLWHANAFLAGDADDVALGNAIIRGAPRVPNHFAPVAAAQLWLHDAERLEPATVDALRQTINDGVAELVDFGLGIAGVTNYSAMLAFFFLAVSERLELYEVPYRWRSIPEVYNRFRLRQFGINLLRLMRAQLERRDLAQEFNSPTYSPITLWGMAEIAGHVADATARELAAGIERRLWQELLAFHHPYLAHNSGPHSRAYMVDSCGHATNWRTLCAHLGIDAGATVDGLLYHPEPERVLGGDLAFRQSLTCWLLRTDYHVPDDLLAAFRARRFPYEFAGSFEWAGKGFRRADGRVVLNVDGDYADRGGTGSVRCWQAAAFSVASMSESNTTMNHPCHVVYALDEPASGPLATRSITTALLTRALPPAYDDAGGVRTPGRLFSNQGHFRTQQAGACVRGTVVPYHWAPLYGGGPGCDEISFNLFISEPAPARRPVACVTLNGSAFAGDAVEQHGATAEFAVADGHARVTCRVRTPQPARLVVCRVPGFVRCAVILYAGSAVVFTPEQLAAFRVEFEIAVAPRGSDGGTPSKETP